MEVISGQALDGKSEKCEKSSSGVITGLATLDEKTLLTEAALAKALQVSKRTIRRMVDRFEIPPSVRLAGKATWQAGAVLRWIEARADRAAREAQRAFERLKGAA